MPDRMGTYHFKINYVTHGWSFVDVYDSVFQRPWHHLEYTKNLIRDLPSALGVVAVMLGIVFISMVFLYDNGRQSLMT